MAERIKDISVFVDESGSFDSSSIPSRYYVVCFLFHDQSVEIVNEQERLSNELAELGLTPDHCVHARPLIRRERQYSKMSMTERRIIFSRMLAFARRINIKYKCFCVDKKFITQTEAIHDDLLQQMIRFLINNIRDLNSYDRLKIYYDNGQSQIKDLLKEAFALLSSKTEFVPEVTPYKYRLFQTADLLCTLELTRIKLDREGRISESEKNFFISIQNLKKHYLKPLSRKLFN